MATATATRSAKLAEFGAFQIDLEYQRLIATKTENPRVGGSNPPLGTILFNDLDNSIFFSGTDLAPPLRQIVPPFRR